MSQEEPFINNIFVVFIGLVEDVMLNLPLKQTSFQMTYFSAYVISYGIIQSHRVMTRAAHCTVYSDSCEFCYEYMHIIHWVIIHAIYFDLLPLHHKKCETKTFQDTIWAYGNYSQGSTI